MKVLVIPDVHLKPWIFSQAGKLMKDGAADRAVCLMDIADDWNKEYDLTSYEQTYDAAISFAREFPDTLWCYGNHDVCYVWNQRESGYSPAAAYTVCRKIHELHASLRHRDQMAYLHRIDNVLFSHGGLADSFVKRYVPEEGYHDVDAVIRTVNGFGMEKMWQGNSPIWYRPQYRADPMYREEDLLQVVGHTPVNRIERYGSVISCDVFSTFQNGKPIGTQVFPVIDTEKGELSAELQTVGDQE